MNKVKERFSIFFVGLALILGGAACGGSSGGGGGEVASNSQGSTTIQGSVSSASATARTLAPGEGGIPGVMVSALGDGDMTDNNGNFSLVVDGNAFPGGPAAFTLSGPGINETVGLENIAGGPGTVAIVDFFVRDNGTIGAESTDVNGNLLSTVGGGASAGECSVVGDFVDGGNGALWKPHSERTGTVVILMPSDYRNADFELRNSGGAVVDTAMIRDCCEHNGGREHFFLHRSAGDLAGAGAPLTAVFSFPDGFVDCRVVPDPNQRYD